jgi:Domain of unknown function (DUF1707)
VTGHTLTIANVAIRQTANTRARDSDRNDTCAVLDSALADGQLSGEEHRLRVASATQATTLGELQALVADLQTANAQVKLPAIKPLPRLAGGWGLTAAAAAALVALGIGIGWGLYGGTGSPSSLPTGPTGRSDGVGPVVLAPPRQLQTLGGLGGLFQQMKQKFGDTTGYRLVVYPDYASLDRPDPGEERRKLSYTYRSGWGDPTGSPKDGGDVPADLSAFDAKAVVGVLRGAPETLGIKAADVRSTYVIFEPSGDVTTPAGTLDVSIYVSSDYGSGYIELSGDGGVKRVNYPS